MYDIFPCPHPRPYVGSEEPNWRGRKQTAILNGKCPTSLLQFTMSYAADHLARGGSGSGVVYAGDCLPQAEGWRGQTVASPCPPTERERNPKFGPTQETGSPFFTSPSPARRREGRRIPGGRPRRKPNDVKFVVHGGRDPRIASALPAPGQGTRGGGAEEVSEPFRFPICG